MISESSEDETMVVKKGRRLHKDNPMVQKVTYSSSWNNS